MTQAPTNPVTSATEEAAVLLFDGVCNLCNSWVNFVIDRDPAGRVRFAALQSESGQRLLAEHGLPADYLGSLVLIADGRAYTNSAAALRCAGRLKAPWSWMKVFLVVPPFLRDWVYGFIAKRRYAWFGQRESCRMPTPELRQRFLED